MAACQIECYGGPMDGKYMPLPEMPIDEACLISIGPDGVPHFYVMRVTDERYFLDYAGVSPFSVVEKLREIGSPYADVIESQLDDLYDEDDE